MIKVKTAKATKLQLDWGLALAMGYINPRLQHVGRVDGRQMVCATHEDGGSGLIDHTDPAVCMSLIKEYCIQLYPFCDGEIVRWDADIRPDVRIVNCDTPEQAVARCVISMKLGETFDVPDELGVIE